MVIILCVIELVIEFGFSERLDDLIHSNRFQIALVALLSTQTSLDKHMYKKTHSLSHTNTYSNLMME
jgi:hypothetical protein